LVDLPWEKLDVTTFSCQKVLGGEASFGFLVLSPRAMERLAQYTPVWPIPRLMRLKQEGAILEDVFHVQVINTISLLVVEDFLNILTWVDQIGGVQALRRHTQANYRYMEEWLERQSDFTYFVSDPAVRAMTPVGLVPTCDAFTERSAEGQWQYLARITDSLAKERFALDVLGHRKSAPHLRFWTGPTVSSTDLICAIEGLSWVYTQKR
jgi:phosphoserine aminotransferase